MLCPQCKNVIPEGRTACLACGKSLNAGASLAPTPMAPPVYTPGAQPSPMQEHSTRVTRNWLLGILGGLLLLFIIGWLAFVMPALQGSPALPVSGKTVKLDPSQIQSQIQAGILNQGGGRTTVECPTKMEGSQGTKWQCVATEATGTKILVDVTLQNDLGEIVWSTN